MGALLRYYLHLDPDQLSDEDFARAWGQLEFALSFEGKIED